MKPLLGLAVLFYAAAAVGQTPPGAALPGASPRAFPTAPNGVHPAVVRVIVPDRDSTSLGSGSLVAVSQNHGLVLTNWHVVRDAVGPITVAFPDGFCSLATLLRVDRDWDLAALAIWRPNVQPIPLATAAPQLGEPLAIAGYGDGPYRAAAGRCTQYVSPGQNLPFEMVELSTAARNGDSGGPIFNTRGELAGVLFGSARGETTGSYCGRVQWFLDPVMETFWRLPPPGTMIAQTPSGGPTRPGSENAIAARPGGEGTVAARPGGEQWRHGPVRKGRQRRGPAKKAWQRSIAAQGAWVRRSLGREQPRTYVAGPERSRRIRPPTGRWP